MRLWKNSKFAVLKSPNSQILKVLFTLILSKLQEEKAARAIKILNSDVCFNKRTDYILSRRKKDREEGGKAPGGRRGQNGTERKGVEPQCHSKRMKDTQNWRHIAYGATQASSSCPGSTCGWPKVKILNMCKSCARGNSSLSMFKQLLAFCRDVNAEKWCSVLCLFLHVSFCVIQIYQHNLRQAQRPYLICMMFIHIDCPQNTCAFARTAQLSRSWFIY